MPAKELGPRAWLDLVIEKAPALRDAGVTCVHFDKVMIELAASDAPARVAATPESEVVDEIDPLLDPATYGGRVPGFRRPADDDEEPS